MRVVSLVPSATETLRAWGVTPVACTRFCEQPDLATVGGTKNPDLAAIVELAPDLVVVDEEENRRQDHDELVDAGLAVHVLAIRSVADLDRQLPALADRVGARWEPLGLPELAEPADLPGFTEQRPDGGPDRHRAFVPIWRRPWMALGPTTYGASLLRSLGVDVVPAGPDPYPEVDLAALAASAEVVLVPSEPYSFRDEHLDELAAVAPPVRVDGQDLFWWGARTAAARARLAAQLADLTP